jgi:hypothetical protein
MGINAWSRFGQENFKTKSNLLSVPAVTVHDLARLGELGKERGEEGKEDGGRGRG